ncbi:MAG: hypothetical protein H0V17_09775 [Deltaproteobacteria bacterium]|nr:hypothetical protein [Deltaproteobacteria bacterium]
MKRLALVSVLVGAFACGNKAKGPPLAPLPPDEKVEELPKPDPTPKVEEPVSKAPVGPLDLKIAARTITVKLLNPGRGKRLPLKVAPKQGGTQAVELALDFGVTQSLRGSKDPEDTAVDYVPTVVLSGKAETKAVAADGADFVLTVDKTDALEMKDAKVPMAKFREVLASTVGLQISGKIGANGATGEITMHLEKQAEASAQVLDLVRLTMPSWPPLPTEPVGVGAKWQATTEFKLADRLDVKAITDYEVTAFKAGVWTIKGTTKVTGADQLMQGGKISKIAGTGTVELTFTDGQLFPTFKQRLETTFSASEAEPKAPNPPTIDFKIAIGAAVTAK